MRALFERRALQGFGNAVGAPVVDTMQAHDYFNLGELSDIGSEIAVFNSLGVSIYCLCQFRFLTTSNPCNT